MLLASRNLQPIKKASYVTGSTPIIQVSPLPAKLFCENVLAAALSAAAIYMVVCAIYMVVCAIYVVV
jgi:hypothetical protein